MQIHQELVLILKMFNQSLKVIMIEERRIRKREEGENGEDEATK